MKKRNYSTKLACGNHHSIILVSGDTAYGTGRNDGGQLGINSTKSTNSPKRIDFSGIKKGEKIVNCFVGYEHSILLSDNGNVYTFGNNSHGQTSQGKGVKLTKIPTLVSFLKKKRVISLSCGDLHTVFVIRDKVSPNKSKIYSVGSNFEGQLGLGKEATLNISWLPIEVVLLKHEHVVKVSCGAFYTIFLNSRGETFACGDAENGSLGLGPIRNNVLTPQFIYFPVKKFVTDVVCGFESTLFLCKGGEVFATGSQDEGQLGITSKKLTQRIPTKVFFPRKDIEIKEIIAGDCHTFFLCKNNNLFACGRCENSQFGIKMDMDNIYSPVLVQEKVDYLILDAGEDYTMVVRSDGTVLSIGSNGEGKLGVGDNNHRNEFTEVVLTNNKMSKKRNSNRTFSSLEDICIEIEQSEHCKTSEEKIRLLELKVKILKNNLRKEKNRVILSRERARELEENNEDLQKENEKKKKTYEKIVQSLHKKVSEKEREGENNITLFAKKMEEMMIKHKKNRKEDRDRIYELEEILEEMEKAEKESDSGLKEENEELYNEVLKCKNKVKLKEEMIEKMKKDFDRHIKKNEKQSGVVIEDMRRECQKRISDSNDAWEKKVKRQTERCELRVRELLDSTTESLSYETKMLLKENQLLQIENVRGKVLQGSMKKKMNKLRNRVKYLEEKNQKLEKESNVLFESILKLKKKHKLHSNKSSNEKKKGSNKERISLRTQLEGLVSVLSKNLLEKEKEKSSVQIEKLKKKILSHKKELESLKEKKHENKESFDNEEKLNGRLKSIRKRRIKVYSGKDVAAFECKIQNLQETLEKEKSSFKELSCMFDRIQDREYLYDSVKLGVRTSVRMGIPIIMKNLSIEGEDDKKRILSNEVEHHKFFSSLSAELDQEEAGFVKLYGVVEQTDRITLVLEQCECDLRSYVSLYTISLEEKIDLLRQAARMYYRMHQRDYVHFDIKGQNVFIKKNQKGKSIVRIGDFDSCRKIDPKIGGLKIKKRFGTPYFFDTNVLPIITSRKQVDTKVKKRDVFAFGCMIFQVVFEITPFEHFMNKIIEREKFFHPLELPEYLFDVKIPKSQVLFTPVEKEFDSFPKDLFDLIENCLNEKELLRPNFLEIEKRLELIVNIHKERKKLETFKHEELIRKEEKIRNELNSLKKDDIQLHLPLKRRSIKKENKIIQTEAKDFFYKVVEEKIKDVDNIEGIHLKEALEKVEELKRKIKQKMEEKKKRDVVNNLKEYLEKNFEIQNINENKLIELLKK